MRILDAVNEAIWTAASAQGAEWCRMRGRLRRSLGEIEAVLGYQQVQKKAAAVW